MGSSLRSLVKKDIRDWDVVLPQAKFTYNHSVSQNIGCNCKTQQNLIIAIVIVVIKKLGKKFYMARDIIIF